MSTKTAKAAEAPTKTAAAKPTRRTAQQIDSQQTDSQVDFATRWVARVITGFVAATALIGLALSFYGLSQGVGTWMELPGWMTYLPAGVLDLGAISFTLAAYRRAALNRATIWQWTCVGIATLTSAAANAAHIMLIGDPTATRIVGAAAAAFAPLWAALATHQVMDLVAPAKPPRVPTTVAAVTPALTPAPTTESPALPASSRPAQGQDVTVPTGRDTRSVPAAERQALRERAVAMAREGSSRSQIAEALGISKGTAVAWCAGITAESQEAVAV